MYARFKALPKRQKYPLFAVGLVGFVLLAMLLSTLIRSASASSYNTNPPQHAAALEEIKLATNTPTVISYPPVEEVTATPTPTNTTAPAATDEPTATDIPATETPAPTATLEPTATPVRPVYTYNDFRAQENLKICKEDVVPAVVDASGNVPEWSFEIPGNSHLVLYIGNGLLGSKNGKTTIPISPAIDQNGVRGENVTDISNTTGDPQTVTVNKYPNFSYHLYCAGQVPDTEKMAGGSVGKQPDNPMTCGLTNGCPNATIRTITLDAADLTLANTAVITEPYAFDAAKTVPIPMASFWKSAGAAATTKLKAMQDQNAVEISLEAGQFARITVPQGKQHRLDIPAGMAVKIYNDATGEILFDASTGGIVILDCNTQDNVTFVVEATSAGKIMHYEYRYGFQVGDAAATILSAPAGQALRAAAVPATMVKYSYDGMGTTTEEIQP